MPRLSKLIEKIEDRLANKWGCWYERNKARVPLYAVLGGIGWYLYGMFLNSLKLGKESVFNTTGEVIESIWVQGCSPDFTRKTDCMNHFSCALPETERGPDTFSAWHGWTPLLTLQPSPV